MKPTILTFIKRGSEQIRKYGFQLLYWRYIYRQKILKKLPISCPPNSKLEIHLQICRRDWLNGLWTLYSFSIYSSKPFRVVLLHDGWLDNTPNITNIYKKQFPGIVIYQRNQLVDMVDDQIKCKSPSIAKLWRDGRYFTLPKIVDSFLLSLNDTYLQLDPDVLFFGYPQVLLESLENLEGRSGCWNLPQDKGHADGLFCFTPNEVKNICSCQLPVPFQIGLGSVNKQTFDWDLAEKVFSTLTIPDSLRFMVDQTFLALMAAKYGFIPLPQREYAVEPVSSLDGVIARHYYSKTRDLMYVEGLKKLSKI